MGRENPIHSGDAMKMDTAQHALGVIYIATETMRRTRKSRQEVE